MIHKYSDFYQYIPDLKRYVKSKIKTDISNDIIQDTMLYLFIKFDKLIITDLKGLMFNTSNFFINKHFSKRNKIEYTDNILKYMYNITETQNPTFKIGIWNSNEIDDKLYKNLRKVSKKLLIPFEMNINNDNSIKEIAKELNLTENAVNMRILRCKKYLQENDK